MWKATRWRLEPLHNLVTSARRAPDNADFVGIKTYGFWSEVQRVYETGFARLCHALEALKKRPFDSALRRLETVSWPLSQ
jgi:hypothetical protein